MADAAMFRHHRRGSVTQEIVDHLRRRIVTGDLTFGRQLPSVRKLARLYGVSVPTMYGAMHALAALGFVRISHGVGSFVARPRSNAAVLNQAWLQATPMELALMRAAIDERMPIDVARLVKMGPDIRLPRTLSDISFFAKERSVHRLGSPSERFLEADLEFHRTIAASVRGAEITANVHEQIGRRLMRDMTPVADVQAGDADLDAAHLDLATAILDGRPISAARRARYVALRELRSLDATLG